MSSSRMPVKPFHATNHALWENHLLQKREGSEGLEKEIATGWKEAEPLSDCVEQSLLPLPSLHKKETVFSC